MADSFDRNAFKVLKLIMEKQRIHENTYGFRQNRLRFKALGFTMYLCLALAQAALSQETAADFSAGGSLRVGADSRTCDATLEGHTRYNSGAFCVETCQGNMWSCWSPSSDIPSSSAIFDLNYQELSTLVFSTIAQIRVVNNDTPISISGAGAEFRICADSACSTVSQAWGSANATIDDGEYVQLRLTTPSTYNTTASATLTISGDMPFGDAVLPTGSTQWDVHTKLDAKRVFITSASYDGGLGGLAGADSTCQSLSDGAGLGGGWTAWLSDSITDVSSRVTQNDGYMLIDGTIIADSWADLTDGTLDNPINIDQNGSTVASQTVYTGTGSNGTKATATFNSQCEDWTYNGQQGSKGGFYGDNSLTTSGWTNAGDATCNNARRLYCFEN